MMTIGIEECKSDSESDCVHEKYEEPEEESWGEAKEAFQFAILLLVLTLFILLISFLLQFSMVLV